MSDRHLEELPSPPPEARKAVKRQWCKRCHSFMMPLDIIINGEPVLQCSGRGCTVQSVAKMKRKGPEASPQVPPPPPSVMKAPKGTCAKCGKVDQHIEPKAEPGQGRCWDCYVRALV